MRQRSISEAEVEAVLAAFQTHYQDKRGNDIYLGSPGGRRIKVVVAKGSNPPKIITAAD